MLKIIGEETENKTENITEKVYKSMGSSHLE